MIVIHHIMPLNDEKFMLTLACERCRPQHRIDFEIVLPVAMSKEASRRVGAAARREHVSTMAQGGCKDALEELARGERR